jgi:hypothetical protein
MPRVKQPASRRRLRGLAAVRGPPRFGQMSEMGEKEARPMWGIGLADHEYIQVST